jgi:protocatechuate 3,4-dioxygenase beta subunit
MRQRHVVALLLVAALAVGAALWCSSPAGDSVVDGSRAAGVTAPGAPTAFDTTETARTAAGRAAARRGDGAIVGSVRVFGSDRPVVGVRVTIESQNVVIGATTGDDGTFAFASVPKAGDWTLTVASEALGEARLAGIVVAARETTDVGVVYLAPKFGVPGVVVDERGAPIAGAAVVVMETREKKGFDEAGMIRELPRPVTPAQESQSGTDGRFRLTGLPPGTYLVYAKEPGFASAVATYVTVAPTASLPVRLVLADAYRVAGRVVRADAGSVGGIPVVAVSLSAVVTSPDAARATKVLATTDAEGGFALDGLGAGKWWIYAAPPGEAVVLGYFATIPRTTFVELRLDGAASLSGRVTGVDGAPVAGAEVVCQSGATVASVSTDAEGRYEMRGLATGTARRFAVHADGYCAVGTDARFDPARRTDAGFVLKTGANTRDVQLVAGGTVRGVVVEDGTTAAVAAATVTVLSGSSYLDVAPSATTDDAGRFEIAGVPVGAAVLVVKKAGWCQTGTADVLAMLQALKPFGPVEEPADEANAGSGPRLLVAKQGDVVERTIAMARGVLLRGRVIGPSELPVAGARVTVEVQYATGVSFANSLSGMAAGGGDPSCLTDADGRFEIAVPIAAGKVHLGATAPGLRKDSRYDIEIGGATPPPDVELQLSAGGTIEGRVTDAAGAPVEGAAVSWRRPPETAFDPLIQTLMDLAESSDDHGRTTTGADGAYRLALVNPSPSSIMFEVHDGRHVPVRRDGLDVGDGKTLREDVTLELGLSITGRVSQLDGRPAVNAWVEVHRDGADEEQHEASGDESKTDPDGRFRVAALAAGRYRLIGHAQGAADGEPVVADAGTDGVEIRLAARLPIAGTVKFRDGRAAVGAKVTATPAGGGREHVARSGDDGAFRFDEVDPGEYAVMAESGPASTDANFRGAGVGSVAAGEIDIAIEVDPGLTISGEVLGLGGAPVASGFVHCTRADRALPLQSSATIRAGRYEAHGLAPGTYVVSVDVRGLVAPARGAEAGATDVSFRVTKGGAIKGRVLLPDGKPASVADVAIEDEGVAPARMSSSVHVDKDGNFTIPVVAAGLHRCTAEFTDYFDEKGRYVGEIRDVRVVEGRTTEGVEIHLKKQ